MMAVGLSGSPDFSEDGPQALIKIIRANSEISRLIVADLNMVYKYWVIEQVNEN